MFRKTYYSKQEILQTLESDLHWVEQTRAEFELGIFQSDVDGVTDKIGKTATTCKLELVITEPDKNIIGNQIVLFIGRKKIETAP